MFSSNTFRLCTLAAVLSIIGPARAQDELTLEGEAWVETHDENADPDIRRARELLAADQPAEAKKILDTWINSHQYSDHPELSDAYLLRGDAKQMGGDEYQALYDYEAVAKRFYGTPAFPLAIEREAEIGVRYLEGLRRRWFGWIRIERAESLGEELLVRVQERMPGSQIAERAALDLADYYYKKRDLPMAADMYGIIVETYPASKHRKYAALREIYSSIAAYKGPKYDRSPLIEAGTLIEDFKDRYPADAEQAGISAQLSTWVDESAAGHVLETARWYLRRNDHASARYTMRRLVREYPESAAAAEAIEIMTERGWLESPPATEAVEEPNDAAP